MTPRRLLLTVCLALATLTGVACQSQEPMAQKDATAMSCQSCTSKAMKNKDAKSCKSCASKAMKNKAMKDKAGAAKATGAKTLADQIQASKTSDVATPIKGPLPADLVLVNTVCPVSNETLDRSDKYMQAIIYKGKVYGVCCSDCLAQAQQNPGKFLGTSDKAK